LAFAPVGAQQPAAPCCGITRIDAASGIVTARVTANGQVFQFKVADARALGSLRVGQGVYANFAGKQVSLDGRRACCAITSGPGAPVAAPSSRINPPSAPPAAAPNVAPPAAAPTVAPAAPPASRAPARTAPTASAALPTVKSVSFVGSRAPAVPVKGGSTWNATGGQEAVLRVELTAPAPCVERCGGAAMNGQRSGYMPVLVSGNNPAQFNVQRVLVSTDQTVGEVKFVTVPVVSPTLVTISAWTEGVAPRQATLNVLPPAMTSFVIDKTNVVGGEVVHATVTFTGPPASSGAVTFSLQTTNSQVLRIPASVVLEPDKTVAIFDIVARGVEQEKSAQVVATWQDRILPVSVAVRATVLSKVERSFPCCDNPFRISLSGGAPPQGAVIQLSSANPARMVVPPTVTISPDSSGIGVVGQSIPGNSATSVTITSSYNGVSKRYSLRSDAIIKPDLVVAEVMLADRFGNPIAAPQDGQPFKLCATVKWQREGRSAPNVPVPPSVLRVSYRSPTGTGTSTGRDVDFPIAFPQSPYEPAPSTSPCLELPGLAPGGYYDVTLTADLRNEVDEDREGNNTRELKITRPPTE
jgi:hypothetical protein